MTATANSGYGFANWSGDLSGTNPTETITVNGNLNIVANFSACLLYTSDAADERSSVGLGGRRIIKKTKKKKRKQLLIIQ